MKRRALTTYGSPPIKNNKTPLRNINFATGEDEDVAIANDNVSIAMTDATVMMLEKIHAVLMIILIVLIIKLFIKK